MVMLTLVVMATPVRTARIPIAMVLYAESQTDVGYNFGEQDRHWASSMSQPQYMRSNYINSQQVKDVMKEADSPLTKNFLPSQLRRGKRTETQQLSLNLPLYIIRDLHQNNVINRRSQNQRSYRQSMNGKSNLFKLWQLG